MTPGFVFTSLCFLNKNRPNKLEYYITLGTNSVAYWAH